MPSYVAHLRRAWLNHNMYGFKTAPSFAMCDSEHSKVAYIKALLSSCSADWQYNGCTAYHQQQCNERSYVAGYVEVMEQGRSPGAMLTPRSARAFFGFSDKPCARGAPHALNTVPTGTKDTRSLQPFTPTAQRREQSTVAAGATCLAALHSDDDEHAHTVEMHRFIKYFHGTLNDVKAYREVYPTRQQARVLLYDAIRSSLADGIYSTHEQQAMRLGAQLLNVPSEELTALERLAREELALEQDKEELLSGE